MPFDTCQFDWHTAESVNGHYYHWCTQKENHTTPHNCGGKNCNETHS